MAGFEIHGQFIYISVQGAMQHLGCLPNSKFRLETEQIEFKYVITPKIT